MFVQCSLVLSMNHLNHRRHKMTLSSNSYIASLSVSFSRTLAILAQKLHYNWFVFHFHQWTLALSCTNVVIRLSKKVNAQVHYEWECRLFALALGKSHRNESGRVKWEIFAQVAWFELICLRKISSNILEDIHGNSILMGFRFDTSRFQNNLDSINHDQEVRKTKSKTNKQYCEWYDLRHGPMHLRNNFSQNAKNENNSNRFENSTLLYFNSTINETISIIFTLETILFMSLVYRVKINYTFFIHSFQE